MQNDFSRLKEKYGMNITGIVHVGAHYGDEIPEYLLNGVKNIVCFEPLKQNLLILRRKESDIVKIFPFALGNEEKNVIMHISSNKAKSSSVLRPKKHLIRHPRTKFIGTEEVSMKKMISFKSEVQGCNYLCLDVQGFEYEVLLGAQDLIAQFDYMYVEVNRDETYENNHLIGDIDVLLSKHHFVRVETIWEGGIWGNALYIKSGKS